MTEKLHTFDIKFDSAGDFDKARELIERMNAALFEKDQRIEELEAENDSCRKVAKAILDVKNMDESALISENCRLQNHTTILQEQIDRVRVLADRIEELEQSEEKLIDERDEMEERVNTICEQLDLSESDATWSNLNDPAERACEYIAAKDRRIEELESEWRVREGYHQKLWNDASDKIHALVAQIDRVRALAEKWTAPMSEDEHIQYADRIQALNTCADELLAALGEPAATPERKQKP